MSAEPDVQHGVTIESIEWAFTTFRVSNWHPLTWISHMVDWSLYGNNPAGHHLTNLLPSHCQRNPAFPFAFVYDRPYRPFRNGCISLRAAPGAC
jgi:hypothetical protein